jgi:FtsZ-binding cell division protein ZapB
LAAPHQEAFSKDQEDLMERVQNVFNSAKSHQARLEQNANLWKNYLDLLGIVQAVIAKAESPEEPATTITALRSNLSNVQSAYAGLQHQQQEVDNLNERARSVEREANSENRQRIQNQLKTINSKWMESLANLDGRKDAISKLVMQWEVRISNSNQVEL